jgi:hypothetical protein
LQDLLLPKPSLGRLQGNWRSTYAWETEQTNIHDIPFATGSVSPPVSLDEKVYFLLFSLSLSQYNSLLALQMTDSYASSRNGDLSPSQNGHAASSPSLGPNAGISSVIRKKLMGYVGFANLPNQVHRKSVRKGFQFTAMVVGESLMALI